MLLVQRLERARLLGMLAMLGLPGPVLRQLATTEIKVMRPCFACLVMGTKGRRFACVCAWWCVASCICSMMRTRLLARVAILLHKNCALKPGNLNAIQIIDGSDDEDEDDISDVGGDEDEAKKAAAAAHSHAADGRRASTTGMEASPATPAIAAAANGTSEPDAAKRVIRRVTTPPEEDDLKVLQQRSHEEQQQQLLDSAEAAAVGAAAEVAAGYGQPEGRNSGSFKQVSARCGMTTRCVVRKNTDMCLAPGIGVVQ